MAISVVKIGNMALSHIGHNSKIESLNEESAEAKEVKLWYDFSRHLTLESLNWSFARKRAYLAVHSDDPPDDWLYRYQYPADCIKLRKLINPAGPTADAVPFEKLNSDDGTTLTIITNLEQAEAEYTFDLQQTSLFTPSFTLALSFMLAHNIAYALTGKAKIKEAMLQEFIGFLRTAQALDAQEQIDDRPRDAEWISGR